MAGPSPPAGWEELRPRRCCRWEEREDGIRLLAPRFGAGSLGRLIGRWFAPSPYRVRLDAIGGFVWRRLDGVRTVEQIGREMRAEFGIGAEPVGERLTRFLRQLRQGRFIELEGEAGEEGSGEDPTGSAAPP